MLDLKRAICEDGGLLSTTPVRINWYPFNSEVELSGSFTPEDLRYLADYIEGHKVIHSSDPRRRPYPEEKS
jgi:hypothetical protein